jgi:hypothetical protein
MPGAVFSPIARQLDALGEKVVPLHVGDTWLEPFAGGRMQDLRADEYPGLHRYSETQGLHFGRRRREGPGAQRHRLRARLRPRHRRPGPSGRAQHLSAPGERC